MGEGSEAFQGIVADNQKGTRTGVTAELHGHVLSSSRFSLSWQLWKTVVA